jgi:hypothetical protein
LKDWIDCTAFDAPLVPSKITMARAALVEEGTKTNVEFTQQVLELSISIYVILFIDKPYNHRGWLIH